jgi:signal transduction histidine kinase
MQDATQQLTGDIHALRSLIAELRPPALDQLGLAPALASLAQRTGAGNGLEIDADVELPDDRRLGAEVETTVYRVVQESLTNVVKHARAGAVRLTVRCEGNQIEICVADDGIGFDAEDGSGAGFGLAGMRERVELAGGELTVAPGAEAGTVIRARLPLGGAATAS